MNFTAKSTLGTVAHAGVHGKHDRGRVRKCCGNKQEQSL